MGYSAKVILDSVSHDGARLTTMEVSFPRIVLAEFNTHRMFSRNSASSRAIPVEKMIARVMEDPFVPIHWGKNQKGMQAAEELGENERMAAVGEWLRARDAAVTSVKRLAVELDVHKQIANRLLEPWLWHTVIVTATEWSNFFALRRHPNAQPEIKRAADLLFEAMAASMPELVGFDDWHTPYVDQEEFETDLFSGPREFLDPIRDSYVHMRLDRWCKVSVGRCARVSYLTHDGVRDPDKDVALAESLLKNGHMSPFEHVARPAHDGDPSAEQRASANPLDQMKMVASTFHGNFRGWVQLRKTIPGEHDFSLVGSSS